MEVNVTMRQSDAEASRIAEWYGERSVLITGATGFMGKVLVEKLLRSCSNIKAIYILIRSKKGIDPIARKEQFFKCVIFNKILKENPDIINKIRVVKGDVMDDGLGLSANDTNELVSNVEVIFHCAANVRFDQPLRPMVEMNVAGTLKLLKLAEKMTNLKVFVHVSTSYCQCNERVLEERAYAAPQDPYEILKMVETMDDAALMEVTPRLLNGLPNTYAYSKALSEDLICRFSEKLPIVITRPSIVTAAVKEPLSGWIEGINGPTGLMIGAARGVIRSMHCNPDYSATIIPVDKAINGMIVAGYQRGNSTKKTEVEFCNLCLPKKILCSWGETIEIGKRLFYDMPLSYALWYPDGSFKINYYHHLFCVIFFHYLPAFIIDFFLFILGRKPFLVRVQKKISGGLNLLQYYTTKDWDFLNDNFQQLGSNLNRVDQEEFDISMNHLNWEKYIRNYIIGMRMYILGETEDNIPHAKKVLRRLYILDRITTYAFYALIFWFLWTHMDNFIERSDTIIRSSIQIIYRDYNKTMHL